jgi:hypothetical protein
VKTENCFPIAAVDADLRQTRVAEKRFKLNTG